MEELSLVCSFAFGKGDVICTRFIGKCHGNSYSMFVHKYFSATFTKANNNKGKLFLQDGDSV